MHIYKGYSRPSSCDYFDTSSKLAISLLTEIHRHLTHSSKLGHILHLCVTTLQWICNILLCTKFHVHMYVSQESQVCWI